MTAYKYARVEWERRFLLEVFPSEQRVTKVRRLVDRYIEGTTLRLREQRSDDGEVEFKLTQKIAEKSSSARQGLVTSMYLSQGEFGVLAKLPAKSLSKSRHSIPPFGVDVFEGELSGLILAEAEFESGSAASSLTLPPFPLCEVSEDSRFTGGRLVTTSGEELRGWLQEYGIRLLTG